jgi:uncharacterized protein YkvS
MAAMIIAEPDIGNVGIFENSITPIVTAITPNDIIIAFNISDHFNLMSLN